MKPIIVLTLLISLNRLSQKTTIYTIGDSTMADKIKPEENPETGWGQVLRLFFNSNVIIKNRAVNGGSTRSFIDEKKWEAVFKVLKPGDYVFIQFGHNDEKLTDFTRYTNPHTTYRHNIIRFVNESREKGAIPILFSSIARRNFNENGVLVGTHGDYPFETRLVALEYNVPFVDLEYYSELLETSYGPEKSKALHLHFKPGENSYYPEGKSDDTHLSRKGALAIARLVVDQIKLMNNPFFKKLKKQLL
ncbi:rhamnogalacturonan acetylesterase [Flavobacterium sp. GSP6]|uniref:rhamnogalacturonan acetylesterase n=1 Tax=Flavobacterium sp. GSP6 TaxID=2497488 RepID=UPI000F88DD5C|nr:rhamnogalacturonan acetylesterase [Flavobacterium sp. GSP6]RTZ03121.1 rhamnogalacturonan acetylesterase [Flavobacterium sp. GSP6]